MGQRTYPKVGKKIYKSWLDLLYKYKLKHVEGASAHTEWDSYCLYKKLPDVTVMIKDEDGEFIEEIEEFENDSIHTKEFKEYIKDSKITKRQREFVWLRDIGNSKSGKCYVCGRTITDDNFEAGHIIAKYNGGTDNVKNLRAVCIPCNRSMATTNLEDFKHNFEVEHTTDRIPYNKDFIPISEVINILEKYKVESIHGKYFEKAIELIQNR
jgi:hypothetical protein